MNSVSHLLKIETPKTMCTTVVEYMALFGLLTILIIWAKLGGA